MAWPKPELTDSHVLAALQRADTKSITPIEDVGNYAVHYHAMSQWFERQRGKWTPETVIIGCLAVYGWMPTILEVKKRAGQTLSLQRALHIAASLNRAEAEADLTFANGSVVGTSKFLHFAFPDEFPIWDSHVRRALVGECGETNPVAEYQQYRAALKLCAQKKTATLKELEQKLFWLGWSEAPQREKKS